MSVKNAIFWDVMLFSPCVNQRSGWMYCLHLQGTKIRERGTSINRWLQTELPVENNWLYKDRNGGKATWEISSEERGGEGSVEMGEQVAGHSWYRSVLGGTRKDYREGIDPVALGLNCQACIGLRSLVDVALYSGGFLREQMRGLHDLLRQIPPLCSYCCDGAQFQWPP
jgi:hypothetical protein